MKKISDSLYIYKGYRVNRNSKEYYCIIITEKRNLPITIKAPTQKGFKSVFNRVMKEEANI